MRNGLDPQGWHDHLEPLPFTTFARLDGLGLHVTDPVHAFDCDEPVILRIENRRKAGRPR